MKKRINTQLIITVILAILSTVLLVSVVFYEFFKKEVQEDLETNAYILKDTDVFTKENIGSFDLKLEDLRITWIAEDGTVLFDNNVDVGSMDNHADRPEVEEAVSEGHGEVIRNSDTVKKNTFYYAVRLNDNSIIRVARQTSSIWSVFESAMPLVLGIILLIVFICILLAHVMTKKLVEPIEQMAVSMDTLGGKAAYKELVPFMNTIREQHEDILKAAKMRQDFTANVSHELKTPLTAITGYAELIEAGIVDEKENKRFAGEIRQNATRLLTLINDIIRLSELDSTDELVSFETVDLCALAKNCVETLKVNAGKHDVVIEYKGSECLIAANREMMVELVSNLCDNAIRYNNKGGRVEVQVEQLADKAILIVKDTGIGIPKEHQERIFERFYRVDKSRSKQTGGTGLGLAIVKHIVALHDAQIEITSEENKGTEIRIIFSKTITI